MPPIQEIIPRFQDSLAGQIVIRLHGPDREGIEQRTGGHWDRLLEPRDGELAVVAGIVRNLLRKDVDVYLNVNNHYEGCAPLTIDRFQNALHRLPD